MQRLLDKIEDQIGAKANHLKELMTDLEARLPRLVGDRIHEQVESHLTHFRQLADRTQADVRREFDREIGAFLLSEKAERGKLRDQVIDVLQLRKDDLKSVTEIIEQTQKNNQAALSAVKESLAGQVKDLRKALEE